MKNLYSISNFRVFDTDGVQITIQPITILTGANSSGKSTIVKSLVLLNDFLAHIQRDLRNHQPIRLSKYQLDFTRKPNNLLGNFSRIRNRRAQKEPIRLGYWIPSEQWGNLYVELSFNQTKEDTPQYGHLTAWTVQNEQGELLDTTQPDLLEHVFSYYATDRFNYVSSSIVTIRRLYPLEEEDDFTALLKHYLELAHANPRSNYTAGTFMNQWVRRFGIGERITISTDDDNLGVTLRLQMRGELRGALLADFGYGITQLFLLLLRIEIAILENQPSATLAFEEPEVHLHPRFQSMLAELFADAYKQYNLQFIIETHSEYLIRKLQTLVAGEVLQPDDVSLVYVYDADPTRRPMYAPQVKHIAIADDGRLSEAFGTGFFDEATNLSMDLLTAKVEREDV